MQNPAPFSPPHNSLLPRERGKNFFLFVPSTRQSPIALLISTRPSHHSHSQGPSLSPPIQQPSLSHPAAAVKKKGPQLGPLGLFSLSPRLGKQHRMKSIRAKRVLLQELASCQANEGGGGRGKALIDSEWRKDVFSYGRILTLPVLFVSGIRGNLFLFPVCCILDLEFFFQIEREGKASLYLLTHFLRFFSRSGIGCVCLARFGWWGRGR